MILIEKNTGKKLDAVIERVTSKEVLKLSGNKNFTFDWSYEVKNEVYKIRLIDKKEILGMLSLIDYQEEFRIHINLIESSKVYRGKNNLIKNIPGSLIGFTCQLSFKRGYDGFVSLTPKTELIKYYSKTYGFQVIGTNMAVYYELSNSIIQKYLSDE